jgi:hypothetical protein
MQDHATQYLKEACQQGNELALKLVQLYGHIADQATRWVKIWQDQNTQNCLSIIGSCHINHPTSQPR